MIEEPLHNEDVDRRLRKDHAERLQAARDGVAETERCLSGHARIGCSGTMMIAELIKAHIELALLERGS